MITVGVDASELDRVAAELRGGLVDRVIDDVAGPAIADLGAVARDRVRDAARRHRRTGTMEGAITLRIEGEGVDTVARIHAGGVAPIIAGGQRPHDIRAIHGRVLSLASPVGAFATRVHHPGVAPDPFVTRGLAAAQGDVSAAAADAARHTAAAVAARLGG